jgi:hypothetical protein
MNENIVNLRLLSHPVNWLVVGILIAFYSFAYAIAHERISQGPIVADT